VALNEKDAREKGERLWRDCMIDLVRAHTQQCAEIRSHNNIPMRARGTTAHAFKTLGIEDPANDVADVLSRKQDVSEVADLKRQLEELKTLMLTGSAKAAAK
jgi:membrane protease subunit (stomatin/prohibitin family)